MTLDELRSEVEQLRKRKKYGLVWEEKPEAVAEQCKAKLPVLSEVSKREVATDPAKPVNLLIEGDNYHALSVLNYTHHGKIDVIYIDPPYNTGARDWQYNNDYVDGEDSFRHSKWLSMMHKRLLLAKNLLSKKGFVCCAIDHNEIFTLGCLMDAIFGEGNRAGIVTVVHNAKGRSDAQFFSVINEYTLVYAKNQEIAELHNFELSNEKAATFNKADENGKYRLQALLRTSSNSNRSDRPKMYFPIYYNEKKELFSLEKMDDSIAIFPVDKVGNEKCWRWGRDRVQNNFSGLVCKVTNGRNVIYTKSRIEDHPGEKARSVWINPKYSNSTSGVQLRTLIGRGKFAYPKSLYAIIDFLKITSQKNSIILDFFAGSGTTGHAALELNKEDDGNRQFILCTNNENKIAEKVTHKRIKKVIKGYRKNGNGEQIAGLGGNLKYYKTAFVTAGENDFAKQQLTEQATEMLCIKEAAFDEVKITQKYKIYRNREKHVAIIFTESAIENCKKCIVKIDGPCTVYVFSLGADADADEFDELGDKVTVEAIPEPILRIYRRLFK